MSTFIPKMFQMFPETSGKLFGQFSVAWRTYPKRNYKDGISLKVQIHGWKHAFYFNKFWKVSPGEMSSGEKSPENISENFVKFRKLFPTGDYFGKFQGKAHKISITESIIYRLETSVIHFLTWSDSRCFRKLPENFSETFFVLGPTCHKWICNNITQVKNVNLWL